MKTLAILAIVAMSLNGATYYIDFATGSDTNNGTAKVTPWRRAPGMNGFAATYTHTAGDQFIFKGGVTWDNTIAPWVIPAANSGTAGNVDYYGVDQTWYSGASWTKPILDGGSLGSGVTTPYWKVLNAAYITIDNLALVNLGQEGVHQDVQALQLYSAENITVQNMTFAPYVRVAMTVFNVSGALRSNITIKDNDISHACWGIGGGPSVNSRLENVYIHGNTFHDFHSQLTNPAGCHGDGIYFYTSNGTDATAYMDNTHVYNNRFYGDFSSWATDPATVSSFIWMGAQYHGAAYVYNNHMSTSAGSVAYPFGVAGAANGASPSPTGTVSILNNSAKITTTVLGFIEAGGVATLTVKNNIFSGGLKGLTNTYSPIGTIDADYNIFYGWTHANYASLMGSLNYTWAQWKTAGYEGHGLNVDPLFVSATDSGSGANLLLQSGSPAINAGANLTSLGITALSNDKNGVARPAAGAWDVGAYSYGNPSMFRNGLFRGVTVKWNR